MNSQRTQYGKLLIGFAFTTQYYYRVRAFNAGGMSAYTDVVSAKTLRK